MTEINITKEYQRKISIKKRATLKYKNNNAFKTLQDHLKGLKNFQNYKIIASFISFKSEFLPSLIIKDLSLNMITQYLP